MKLLDKVAIITGGTSGIGEATAKLFAKEGAKIVIVGRNEKKGKSIEQAIRKEGGEAFFVKTDVSRSSEVKNMIEKTIKVYKKIDILFNNAGINPVGTVIDTSEEVWDNVMNTNLKGMFLCCKYAIPHMLQAGGVIVNTGSANCFMAWENEVAYDASKGGVLMFTKATALDFAKKNIRVNCICPGVITTPLYQIILDEAQDPEKLEREMKSKHPMNRFGTPVEVAKLALFLVSDDSSFITGAAFTIDGGLLAGWPS